jgi:hypothetical protein
LVINPCPNMGVSVLAVFSDPLVHGLSLCWYYTNLIIRFLLSFVVYWIPQNTDLKQSPFNFISWFLWFTQMDSSRGFRHAIMFRWWWQVALDTWSSLILSMACLPSLHLVFSEFPQMTLFPVGLWWFRASKVTTRTC